MLYSYARDRQWRRRLRSARRPRQQQRPRLDLTRGAPALVECRVGWWGQPVDSTTSKRRPLHASPRPGRLRRPIQWWVVPPIQRASWWWRVTWTPERGTSSSRRSRGWLASSTRPSARRGRRARRRRRAAPVRAAARRRAWPGRRERGRAAASAPAPWSPAGSGARRRRPSAGGWPARGGGAVDRPAGCALDAPLDGPRQVGQLVADEQHVLDRLALEVGGDGRGQHEQLRRVVAGRRR